MPSSPETDDRLFVTAETDPFPKKGLTYWDFESVLSAQRTVISVYVRYGFTAHLHGGTQLTPDRMRTPARRATTHSQ